MGRTQGLPDKQSRRITPAKRIWRSMAVVGNRGAALFDGLIRELQGPCTVASKVVGAVLQALPPHGVCASCGAVEWISAGAKRAESINTQALSMLWLK